MCPFCVVNLALLTAGISTAGGLKAFVMSRSRKRNQALRIKNKL